jgi:RNA polymerase sigma factor (sigma-70 family)
MIAMQPLSKTTNPIKEFGKKLFVFIRGKVRNDADAEDLLQEVWFHLYNSTEIIEQPEAWLYRVAQNKIIDSYRKKKPELFASLLPGEDDEDQPLILDILLADTIDPETEYLKNMFWEQLHEGLKNLPPEQRSVFILNELEGISFAAIAAQTGENIKTLISRKGYAVKYLRQWLQTVYNEFLNY